MNAGDETGWWLALGRGILGVAVLVGLAFCLSRDRKSIRWRIVAGGMLLQLLIAALALRVAGFEQAMRWLSQAFVQVLGFSVAGVNLLFGSLADESKHGVIAAFQIGATIIFFSALSSLLYYLRVLQWIVYGLAWLMRRTMKLSGPECLAAAANVFVGQTEAPLLVRPYLKAMTRSEVMALMTGGMATIAGGMMAAYISFLGGGNGEAEVRVAQMLITASLMSAPAALLFSKILEPETEQFTEDLMISRELMPDNMLDAITKGASDGLKLMLNVFAMLIAFVGLIHLLNWILVSMGGWLGLNGVIAAMTQGAYDGLSLDVLAGFFFAPLAWVIGVPVADLLPAGELLGKKFFFNEFVAYLRLAEFGTEAIHPKTVFLMTFALCGFSNFASVGIQIGGIGALEPELRPRLLQLGLRAMIAGTLATLSTAAVAGVFYLG